MNRWFTPDSGEVTARARLELQQFRQETAWLDDSGRFVDPALLANARLLVDLADEVARGAAASA